jgi:hypothetical protein
MKLVLGLVVGIGLLMVLGALNSPDQATRDAKATADVQTVFAVSTRRAAPPTPTSTREYEDYEEPPEPCDFQPTVGGC